MRRTYEQWGRGDFRGVVELFDPHVMFIPLSEAISWAVSFDGRFQTIWKTAPTNPSKWWSDGFINGDTVGHATIAITLNRYGHLMPGNENEAAGMPDAYLARCAPVARQSRTDSTGFDRSQSEQIPHG